MCQKGGCSWKTIYSYIMFTFVQDVRQKQVKRNKSSQDTSSTDSLDDSFYPIVNLGTNLVRETFYQDFLPLKIFKQ